MKQDKIVVRREEAGNTINKGGILSASDNGGSIEEGSYGLKLTLDNSLSKYANDPFIVQHNEKVSRKLAPNKPRL